MALVLGAILSLTDFIPHLQNDPKLAGQLSCALVFSYVKMDVRDSIFSISLL